MILFESGEPVVRGGEFDLGGRRIAVRGWAYAGEIGPPGFRFDPLDRRLVARRAAGTLSAGPFSSEPWTAAFSRAAAGAALVEGSTGTGEAVCGAYRAAAEGAIASGRGTYLLDPPPDGLPKSAAAGPGRLRPAVAVALFAWSPETGIDTEAISMVREQGIDAGIVWPLIPGWTGEANASTAMLRDAARAGAGFALAIAPVADAEFRRLAVEARLAAEPAAAEAFFDAMHHRSWEGELPDAQARARLIAHAAGLASIPPRPASRAEPATNAAAAGRLEERAAGESDEHRSSRLHAAVRWIDACARDLAPVVREGNFGRVFPLGSELAREVEDVLREALA